MIESAQQQFHSPDRGPLTEADVIINAHSEAVLRKAAGEPHPSGKVILAVVGRAALLGVGSDREPHVEIFGRAAREHLPGHSLYWFDGAEVVTAPGVVAGGAFYAFHRERGRLIIHGDSVGLGRLRDGIFAEETEAVVARILERRLLELRDQTDRSSLAAAGLFDSGAAAAPTIRNEVRLVIGGNEQALLSKSVGAYRTRAGEAGSMELSDRCESFLRRIDALKGGVPAVIRISREESALIQATGACELLSAEDRALLLRFCFKLDRAFFAE